MRVNQFPGTVTFVQGKMDDDCSVGLGSMKVIKVKKNIEIAVSMVQ